MRIGLLMLVIGPLVAQTKMLPKDRSEDTYAVYSAVLAHPKLSHSNENRKYLIEDTTAVDDASPGKCLRVPEKYSAKVEENLAEYEQYKAERFQLERKLEVDRPYDLITQVEAKQVREFRMMPHLNGEQEPEKFRGAQDVITLGNVYFDKSRTVAIVRTGAWCGGLCGLWTWRALIKENGSWVEQPWAGCVSMAMVENQGFWELKNTTLSTFVSTATSKNPTIISSQLCSPHLTSAFGSGLRGLLAELSK
jgi:hypothetical protein